MTVNYSVLQSPYLQDILDQPRALKDTAAALADSHALNGFVKGLSVKSHKSVVLTGMGGSFHILYPLYLDLVDLGFPVRMAETSELIHFMPRLVDRDTLLIVVSQSGRSAEIVRLLALHRKSDRPTILGVMNDISSPLGVESDVVAQIQAGQEATVSCKTTTASLLALAWIADSIRTKDLSATASALELAAPAVSRYLTNWRQHVDAAREELMGMNHLFVTGRGSSLAAAGIGGMIMKETAHFHSEGLSGPALRHGPFEMLGKDSFVLVFAGASHMESVNKTLVADIRKTGAKAALAGPGGQPDVFRLPAVSKQICPIVEMLPLQMVSLALAEIAGREAGKFEHISKVTTEE